MSSAIRTSSALGSPTVGRRTVAAGAMWAVPVIAVAAAAPAVAASQCVVTTTFDNLQPGTSPATLTFLPSTITASIAYSSTGNGGVNTPGATGQVAATSSTPPWNYIEVEMLDPIEQGDSVTVTLSFTSPVENLTFKLHDIDGISGAFQDTVEILTLTNGFSFVPGANITGNGTSGNRFRNVTSVDNPISTGVADVTLMWAGPIQVVSFRYVAGTNGDSQNQHIGLGDISFTDCVSDPGSSRRMLRRPATATPIPDDLAESSAESDGTVDR